MKTNDEIQTTHHTSHGCCIPGGYILVEGRCFIEQTFLKVEDEEAMAYGSVLYQTSTTRHRSLNSRLRNNDHDVQMTSYHIRHGCCIPVGYVFVEG